MTLKSSLEKTPGGGTRRPARNGTRVVLSRQLFGRQEHGIQHKRGYLFYGVPGSGKTSQLGLPDSAQDLYSSVNLHWVVVWNVFWE